MRQRLSGGRAGGDDGFWRSVPRNAGVVVAALTDVRLVEMRLVKVVGLSIGGTAALPAFAVFGSEEERDLGEPQEAGAAASPREESPTEQAEVILTPDQRVRVFISSTLEELAAERAAARRAIARLHLVPVWYESGARPHPPRSMYRAYLAQSQVFVGIYWQRYGWVAPGMEISGLEDEYRLAARQADAAVLEASRARSGAAAGGDDRWHPRGRDGVLPDLWHAAGAGTAPGRRPCRSAERELCGRGDQHGRGAAGRDGHVLADRHRGFHAAVGDGAGGDGGGARAPQSSSR